MDGQSLRVLEFDKVLEMAAAFAVSAPGRTLVRRLSPFSDIDTVRRRIGLVSECRRILSEGEGLGIEHFEEIDPLLKRLKPADSVLDPAGLRRFLPLFSSAINIRAFFDAAGDSFPLLGELASSLTTHPLLKREIEASIDGDGRILDDASPELSSVREGIRRHEGMIRRALEDLLRRSDLKPHIQEFYITERNGRPVVPVKRDSKGHVRGVVHDISNSGETLFIEPYETLHLGNELESLRAEEKVEEYRVLRRLSALIREAADGISGDCRTVTEFDALGALAAFSESMDMTPPEINDRGVIRIVRGMHPLLWQTLKRLGREESLEPLDFELGNGFTCIVITGSNAGGKTVVLKTVGVLQLMAMSGMHLPAASGTTMPMLAKVLADIGDEQSIEQNLSTFSAHVGRISEILRRSDRETLVIIDELGTGTDPDEGGALSCAILKELKRKGALTAVSTHLGLLKAFAYTEPAMINGAMEMEALQRDGMPVYRPTYRLVIGEIGRSHAFEIAGRLGLPPELIGEARQIMKESGGRIEAFLEGLKKRSSELDRMLAETARLRREAAGLRESLREEIAKVRAEKKEILSKALREAEEILLRARREAREALKALRRASAAPPVETVRGLDQALAGIRERKEAFAEEKRPLLDEVREGQAVFVGRLGLNGTVRSVNPKTRRCRVVVRGREIEVPLGELSAAQGDAGALAPRDTDEGVVRDVDAGRDVPAELDLRGQRVDPALSALERYLNDASIAGLGVVRIVHGIGEGRLSAAVRDYLEGHPLVRDFRSGGGDEGGDAVTVVSLK